jgi:hypothetical protein
MHNLHRFVTGHDLSRAANGWKMTVGFTGCGKTLFVSKGKKQIAPGSSRSDPQGAVDGFISPNFRPFDILSEFFRSL